ncbi:unnamed protein product [Rotaria magnacalcarata]
MADIDLSSSISNDDLPSRSKVKQPACFYSIIVMVKARGKKRIPGSNGIHRDPLGSTGIYWDPPGSIGIHWDPLESIGIHRDPLGSIGIYRDPSGSISMNYILKNLQEQNTLMLLIL